MAVPHELVQKDEGAAIAAARQGISNGSRSINDLPGSVSFSAALSLQAKMCRQRLRRRVETALSSCYRAVRAFPSELVCASTLYFPSSARRRRRASRSKTVRSATAADANYRQIGSLPDVFEGLENGTVGTRFCHRNTGRDGVDDPENYRGFSLAHTVLRPGQPSLYIPNVSARGFFSLRKRAADKRAAKCQRTRGLPLRRPDLSRTRLALPSPFDIQVHHRIGREPDSLRGPAIQRTLPLHRPDDRCTQLRRTARDLCQQRPDRTLPTVSRVYEGADDGRVTSPASFGYMARRIVAPKSWEAAGSRDARVAKRPIDHFQRLLESLLEPREADKRTRAGSARASRRKLAEYSLGFVCAARWSSTFDTAQTPSRATSASTTMIAAAIKSTARTSWRRR
jgi:hypothetical protein